MPKQLQPGILYVSEKFGTAAHLCACGCGEKIRTPLGPTEWSVRDTAAGPSVWPSVGNWQKPCQSHYVIQNGKVVRHAQWSAAQIAAGRHGEQQRRKAHYNAMYAKTSPWQRFWRRLKSLFGVE
ncbi:DUF6527 family protein [Bradyrhizobium yuanmingense]|uniref:DUF6527 family protein n=1 Tax=Bradyrhizobium yuanmingense TaxID=108015 RepID=UPI0023B9E61C|nr:DUF6527 family protein [Bradyrhizobium yuanmingense]MDF0584750.1 DUF6527 family protein [Bradyrhizobium yuanmingense]